MDSSSPAADGPPQEGKALFAERDRIARLSRIRQLVFGSLDGLIVPLGVVSGVAGGTGNSRAVIVAGLAEAFAGALSMAAGEFIAARAEAQVHATEVQRELEEMRTAPEYEAREMVAIFEADGVAHEDAQKLVSILTRYPKAYAEAMVSRELGIADLSPETVKLPEALTIGGAYLVGSIFPLMAYFIWPIPIALPVSLVLTFLALVFVGIFKGTLARMNLVSSVVEIVVVGTLSAGGGYLLGVVIPRLLGFE
jgi:VIT1/CCC1 family predicted Fe2+/Mn2+ transporter